ncbi:hypothetical protein SAMN05216505_102490 [Streptomyces prasinopilosus]|uniref:Uncharacterized protein n=1 Tax=Streptomyces prasinopilosus TaxID=67344 RepID=A0A1G6MF26_9ACTN|nr:hypothetical protein SAMN05216505_102490 [Streptomyces prasinopilosus]
MPWEKEPAQTAAGTFPRAGEVKAIDDRTVEGTSGGKEQSLAEGW